MSDDILDQLEHRLGRIHASQRLGVEHDHEEHIFGGGINFFHPENWYSAHALMRGALKLSGLYGRGTRNADQLRITHNRIALQQLPARFDGFSLLHVSDMHADISVGAMTRLVELLPGVTYDICVLTGDFRGQTYGPFEATLELVARVRERIDRPVYAVLGNHDSIRMVPALEALDIRLLVNESETIVRDGDRLHLAGIDDAHYYRADDIEKAAALIPRGECSILLSHTPEIYRAAADADFNLLLSGHTHGGQICLPGSIPITLDSVLPRRMGAGAWRYGAMAGYTSVGAGTCMVPVRFNCPPEITVHHLVRAGPHGHDD